MAVTFEKSWNFMRGKKLEPCLLLLAVYLKLNAMTVLLSGQSSGE